MKNMYRLFSFLLVLALLTACAAPAPVDAPTAADQPTATAPAAETTPTADVFAQAAALLNEMDLSIERIPSPDRNCTWERLIASPLTGTPQAQKYENQFYTRAEVECYQNPAASWVAAEAWKEQAMGYSLPALFGWSADGQRLYFMDAIIPDGCQPIGGFQENLRELNLQTGAIHAFALQWTGGMALSPDTHSVIYYERSAAEIGIYDLLSGTEERFAFASPTASWYAGEFTWSPDGQFVLFISIEGDPCYPEKYVLHRLDVQNADIQVMYETAEGAFRIDQWLDPQRVRLSVSGEPYDLLLP